MARKNKFHTVYVVEKELKDHLVEWVATALTIFGAAFNANLVRLGELNGYAISFHFWSAANLLWIAFALKHRHWGVLVTFGILLIVNVWSIVQNKLWLF